MDTEIFALDLGNKQTKLKSSKKTYILPSHFFDAENFGENFGVAKSNTHQRFQVPFSDSEYIWGTDIDALHLDNYMIDTLIRGNRYADESFKLLANFSLGLLANDFVESKEGILTVDVVTGIPSKDYFDKERKQTLMDVLSGQHQIDIDQKTVTVKVKNVYIVPQPIGTLYNELVGADGVTIKNENLMSDKIGVVDIGGGTILIDTILNFRLIEDSSKQINTGINDLYQSIASSMNGEVSLYKIAETVRAGNKNQEWIYSYSRNNQINITELVNKKINSFTRLQANKVNSTLDDKQTIDTLLFTGGGSSLVNRKLILKTFNNAQFVEEPELANVLGFYKFGKNYTSEN